MTDPKSNLKHGRRYSPAKKTQILKDADEVGPKAAADKHDCSEWRIFEWRKKRGTEVSQSEAQPESSATLEETQEQRYALILEREPSWAMPPNSSTSPRN